MTGLKAARLCLIALASLGACSSDDGTDLDGITPGRPRLCIRTCMSVSDCTSSALAASDEDNWSCNAQQCESSGCNSDAECQVDLPDTVCRPGPPSSPLPRCLPSCTSVSDCTDPSRPLRDDDNFECRDGACEYLGCADDAECQAVEGPDWVCSTRYPVPVCVKTCSTPADCSIPGVSLLDEDNWLCRSGECEALGCVSAQECNETFTTREHVCQ